MTEQEILSIINSKLNTSTDNKGYTYKTLIIAILVAFIAGLIVGSYITKNYFPTLNTEVKTVQTDPIVTEKVKVVTDTQIAYVPKEIIRYVDKTTGQEVTAKESTDVQFDVAKPKVVVKVNGQDHEFYLLQGETQKFENGKVDMQQTSTIGLDVKVPTIDKTKNGGITLEVTNKDISTNITYKKLGLVAGKMYDGDLRIGASYTPIRF
jgi:uncharacterized protein YneF (UPF0154 family)